MKTYKITEFLSIENENALNTNQSTKALLKDGFKLVEIAKDNDGNIRQVKHTANTNTINKVFLCNIDSDGRTLSQKKTREIIAYFKEHERERSATFTETFSSGSDENGKSIKDNVVAFVVTYHGNGYDDFRNYSVSGVVSNTKARYEFVD